MFDLSHFLGQAVVYFNVTYTTASSSDVTISPANGIVTFQDGDASRPVTITIQDDTIPEMSEELRIQLTSVTGKGTLLIIYLTLSQEM